MKKWILISSLLLTCSLICGAAESSSPSPDSEENGRRVSFNYVDKDDDDDVDDDRLHQIVSKTISKLPVFESVRVGNATSVEFVETDSKYARLVIKGQRYLTKNFQYEIVKNSLVLKNSSSLKIIIFAPSISKVECTGVSIFTANSLKTGNSGRFTARLSGDSSIKIDNLHCLDVVLKTSGIGIVDIDDLEAESVKIDASGMSRIDLSGTAGYVKVSSSGASSVDISGLVAEEGDISISGMGDADVNIRAVKKKDVSGMSSFKNHYKKR